MALGLKSRSLPNDLAQPKEKKRSGPTERPSQNTTAIDPDQQLINNQLAISMVGPRCLFDHALVANRGQAPVELLHSGRDLFMPTSQKFGFRHFDTTHIRRQSFPLRRYQPAEPKKPREKPPSVKRMLGARIFSHPDNSPVRTPGGRGGLNPRGYIPSYKTLRKQPFESDPELDYMLVFEADADVVAYFMQPHRLEMYVIGRDDPLVYFPDVRLEVASGRVKIHEIKVTDDAAQRDPDYALKLQLAEEVYAEQGWEFEILTEEGLRDDLYRLANARKIARDSDTVLGTADVLRLHSHMDSCNGVSTYHDVARALAPEGTEPEFVGRAKLHALIVRRRIRMDLRMRLVPAAPVWLVAANGSEVAP